MQAKTSGIPYSHKKLSFYYDLVRMQGCLVQCFLFRSTLKAAVLNLACTFFVKGYSSVGQPSAVDSCLTLSHGACAAPEEHVAAIVHLEEDEGGINQDICQGTVHEV